MQNENDSLHGYVAGTYYSTQNCKSHSKFGIAHYRASLEFQVVEEL